jgi:hypothetical protein
MRGRAFLKRSTRGLGWTVACLVAVSAMAWPLRVNAAGIGGDAGGTCRVGVLEGDVRAGESFERPIGEGLKVRLEALSWGSGWVLKILPVGEAAASRPAGHDYAQLATPPYASVNPLILSTDFSFRSQDAIAWNPRRFRYAASSTEFGRLMAAYERFDRVSPPSAESSAALAALASKAQQGTLQILDAKLVPGSANQAGTASTVASHFSTTAHTIEEEAGGQGSSLGKLIWVRFRIALELKSGFRTDRLVQVDTHKCQ